MIDGIPDLDLFLRFVELDGSTEGKSHEPIRWLKAELAQRGWLESARLDREAELLGRPRGAGARARPGRAARAGGASSAPTAGPRGSRPAPAGRPTRDGAADRSAQVKRGSCASQLRCLARSVGEGARGAEAVGRQAVLAKRRELDDEVERGADLLSEPGEHAFEKVRRAVGWNGRFAATSLASSLPPVIHLRIVAPEEVAHQALEVLEGSPAVLNIVHLHGVAQKPDGDVILCDVAREEASVIIGDLKELEIPRVGLDRGRAH